MGNNDIIVSNEKGTILNYFGSANTYDPFTNQSKLQTVKDLDFNIPNTVPFETADFVAVSTGLLATSMSFLNYCQFSILDKRTGQKIIDLKNYIGEIGNSSFYPNEEQIFWFNKDGLKGTFYLNKCHAGRVLHITNGMFTTTSITSGVLNDMFERTVGVPAYIQSINNRLAEQDRIIADTKLVYDSTSWNWNWNWNWSWNWNSRLRTIQILSIDLSGSTLSMTTDSGYFRLILGGQQIDYVYLNKGQYWWSLGGSDNSDSSGWSANNVNLGKRLYILNRIGGTLDCRIKGSITNSSTIKIEALGYL